MSDVHVKLIEVDGHRALYSVVIDGSEAVAKFAIKSEDFAIPHESEHFKMGVHRCIELLQMLDPDNYEQDIHRVMNEY